MTSYNEITLPWLRVFIGAIFIFLGLSATISFLSQGFSGIAFLIVLAFCIGIEVTKILLGGDVGFYFALKKPDKAMFSALIVFILVCLSLTAEMFFFSSGNLTDQAKLQTVTGKTTAIKQQLEAAQTNLSNCNPSYVTKCQKPLNAQIERLQKELSSAMGAESEQAAAIGTAKFYELLAKVTGTSQDNLMMGINFLRALLGEILGLYLTSQFATYQRLKS